MGTKKKNQQRARARDSLWPKGILKISRAIDLWAKTTTKVIYQLIDILDSSLFILKKKKIYRNEEGTGWEGETLLEAAPEAPPSFPAGLPVSLRPLEGNSEKREVE